MTAADLKNYLDGWAPPALVETDPLRPEAADQLRDILDAQEVRTRGLPPLWHWGYFTAWPPESDLAADGHPTEGHFMPPLPNRKRMWAGGTIDITDELDLDTMTTRTATLREVQFKQGRSGAMVLVTVEYVLAQHDQVKVTELQNHVYRIGDGDTGRTTWGDRPTRPPVSASPWQFPIRTDPIRLFRMSSLTANSHRIHYDRAYAQNVEHYPDLVVHGPLLAMQLALLAARNAPDHALRRFSYRLQNPVFVGEPVLATGTCDEIAHNAELVVVSDPQTVHASANATYSQD